MKDKRLKLVKLSMFLLLLLSTFNVFADCNTPITRNNFIPNTVLTSTELNDQFNTVYTESNAEVDGDCIEDDSIPLAKLDSTELGPLTKGVQRGCKVVYDNASTVGVEDCLVTVNGNSVTTTTTTNVSMGCPDCSAEAPQTFYYVYVKNNSSGSTLNLFLSTTVPDSTGYDGSDNLVIGRLYNDNSSDILSLSIDQFHINKFIINDTKFTNVDQIEFEATTTNPTKASNLEVDKIEMQRLGNTVRFLYTYRSDTTTTGGAAGSGDYLISLPTIDGSKLRFDTTYITFYTGGVGAATTTDQAWRVLGFMKGIQDGVFTVAAASGSIPYDADRFRNWLISTAGGVTWLDFNSFDLADNNTGWVLDVTFPIEGLKSGDEF